MSSPLCSRVLEDENQRKRLSDGQRPKPGSWCSRRDGEGARPTFKKMQEGVESIGEVGGSPGDSEMGKK